MPENTDEDFVIPIQLNAHQFLAVEEPWASHLKLEIGAQTIVDFLCTPGLNTDPASLVSRYREIAFERPRLFAVPADERILDKLVWPLRHAKAGYMLGNYIGTIALSGMVSEMVAILAFETAEIVINGQPLTVELERQLFGSTFEKLGQERRVAVLAGYSIIDASLITAFDTIRTIRRKYLHLWSQDHASLPADAVNAFRAAVTLAVGVIGQDMREGKLILRPAMVRYLKRKGFVQPAEE